ncbi:DUF6350 family protein [Streptomyces sp. NPDC007264]|uniref:cell division protein PerM n=1 Tax=Streptomyces sp. NPDC007264 TaxID=3364777 RepID=UPI0036D77056
MAVVTQWTDRRTTPSLRARLRDRSPGLGAGLLGGAGAAVLGLGSLALLAMLLWISSPYPDSGPGGALRAAAALWLLAHGVVLVRTETLSGVPAPVGVTPLLLVVLPVWLLHRAARDATDGDGVEAAGGTAPLVPARTAWSGVVAGYLAVGAVATLYASGGVLRPSWRWTAVCLPLVALVAAGTGVWTAYGRPLGRVRRMLDRLPTGLRRAVTAGMPRRGGRAWLRACARAALGGTAVLVGGGALLVGLSLGWHGEAARTSFLQLTEGWSGRCAVALLAVALVPNAAVWGAAYGLGPGFLLGAGHVAGPLSSAAPPAALPPFPLLTAVPATGGTPLYWAVGAVPVAAGMTVGWFVAGAACRQRDRDAAWSMGRTAGAVVVAAAMCAALLGGLAEAAGGPLGVAALSRFGPVGWQVGGAAAAWTLVVGAPVAGVVRAWRLRGLPRPGHGRREEGKPERRRRRTRRSHPVPLPMPLPQPPGSWLPRPSGLRTPEPAGSRPPQPVGDAPPGPAGGGVPVRTPDQAGSRLPDLTGSLPPGPVGGSAPGPVGGSAPESTGAWAGQPTGRRTSQPVGDAPPGPAGGWVPVRTPDPAGSRLPDPGGSLPPDLTGSLPRDPAGGRGSASRAGEEAEGPDPEPPEAGRARWAGQVLPDEADPSPNGSGHGGGPGRRSEGRS